MPDTELIKCPSCEKEDYEVHLISNLHFTPKEVSIQSTAPANTLIELNVRKYFTCLECNYVISSPDDLEMITIDVYIVGDSISGRRQGLNKITKGVWSIWQEKAGLEMVMKQLAKDGFVRLMYELDGITPKNDSPWVFTKGAWKRAENDPGFRLTEGQYAVNIKEMI